MEYVYVISCYIGVVMISDMSYLLVITNIAMDLFPGRNSEFSHLQDGDFPWFCQRLPNGNHQNNVMSYPLVITMTNYEHIMDRMCREITYGIIIIKPDIYSEHQFSKMSEPVLRTYFNPILRTSLCDLSSNLEHQKNLYLEHLLIFRILRT